MEMLMVNFFGQDNNENIDKKECKKIGITKINNDILKTFKLPISYIKNKSLNKNIIQDLELIKKQHATPYEIEKNEIEKNEIEKNEIEKNEIEKSLLYGVKDVKHKEEEKPIYDIIFNPSTIFGINILKIFPEYYTTNTKFLKDTQYIIKNIDKIKSPQEDDLLYEAKTYDEVLETYNEIKNDNGFLQKYLYIDYENLLFLNNNEFFLQFLSIYNIFSPLVSFITPLLILIIPFFIINMQGISLTFEIYKKILYKLMSEHSLGKIFTDFNKVEMDKKVYLIISGFFYLFSIYSNIITCIRFYKNMIYIHNKLHIIQDYIKETIIKYNNFQTLTSNMTSYSLFNNTLKENIENLKDFDKDLDKIYFPFSFSFKKTLQIGKILKLFYKLYNDENLNKSFLYSFGFNGYIDILNGVRKHIHNDKNMNYVSFLSKKNRNKTIYKNMFYPVLMKNDNKVKNDFDFKNNVIITGVNASGKTTILKSVLINTILSQQIGVGCFDKGFLYPFQYIHCYLNILDTSDRFSLFQSECNKCKDILNIINEKSKKSSNHLCIFDELFSGTNPDEAINCGYGFLLFLTKVKLCRFFMTTHFIELSNKFLDNKKHEYSNTINKKMVSVYDNNTQKLKHTYLLKNGINQLKGGIEVLKEMNYPTDILDTILSSS
jgi:hypothetical protein